MGVPLFEQMDIENLQEDESMVFSCLQKKKAGAFL